MADYYSKTVITTPVLLTENLVAALSAMGGDLWSDDASEETVLDGIVHGRPPLKRYYVTFPDGWSELVNQFDSIVDACADKDIALDECDEELRRLLWLDEPELLREVLLVNPDLTVIELQTGLDCSRMRLDGFGGRGLHVTRKGYLYIDTGSVEVAEDGTVRHLPQFVNWGEPQGFTGK